MKLTPDQVDAELAYRTHERLGILHDDNKISLAQYIQAENEAKAWLELARKDGLIE